MTIIYLILENLFMEI